MCCGMVLFQIDAQLNLWCASEWVRRDISLGKGTVLQVEIAGVCSARESGRCGFAMKTGLKRVGGL